MQKLLSPIIISNGLVYGWAFDSLRPHVTLVLSVNGSPCSEGTSGFTVHDSFYASTPPPARHCGFCLPLPAHALDGWPHSISVEVKEWKSLPDMPSSQCQWFSNACFGEVYHSAMGYKGWVGFRVPLESLEAAPVLAHAPNGSHINVQTRLLAKPTRVGCQAQLEFSLPLPSELPALPLSFTCLGTTLRQDLATPANKIVGDIESITPEGIYGWALNSANPAESLDLVVEVDGYPVKRFRPNLKRSAIARHLHLLPEESGVLGFEIDLPPQLLDGEEHLVAIRSFAYNTALTAQPKRYKYLASSLGLQEAKALLTASAPTANQAKLSAKQPAKQTALAKGQNKPLVSIVILNRNGADCLDGLLTSFELHNTVAVEYIVIDHGSSDESLGMLEGWRNRINLTLVALDYNDSFSASCNRGARLAKGKFVLFLNNDIVWLQDALPALLASATKPGVGAVGMRLLKAEYAKDLTATQHVLEQDVQHLGVRYTLVGNQYWPYEANNTHEPLAHQYSVIEPPIVTAAVTLCRTATFLNHGGFDEQYFYGYEDVELCLRLRYRHKLKIICRNDVCALHYHGFTRFNGKDPAFTQRQMDNQKLLQQQTGLWLKRAFWQDLLQSGQMLADTTFTIGLAIDTNSPADTEQTQLEQAIALAENLKCIWPSCNPVFLLADKHWYAVNECHLLLALSPYYDLRQLQSPRADLRSAIYIAHKHTAETWESNPSLPLFDSVITAPKVNLDADTLLQQYLPIAAGTSKKPVADLANPERLSLLLRGTNTSLKSSQLAELTTSLKLAGVLIRTCELTDEPQSTAGAVADIHITLFDSSVSEELDSFTTSTASSSVKILWVLEDGGNVREKDTATQDGVWLTHSKLKQTLRTAAKSVSIVKFEPAATDQIIKTLTKLVETSIGRTFHTP